MERLGLFPSVWLEEERQPRVHAYYFKQWERYDMPYHRHDSTEIMYVISGECEVWLQAGQARGPDVFGLKKGEFILLNANANHRLVVADTCRMLNVEFGPAAVESAVPSLKRLAGEEEALRVLLGWERPHVVLRDTDDVYHALKSLVLELGSVGMDGGALARLLIGQLLIRIGRLREEAEADRSVRQAALYVKQSAAFLSQNYDRDIRIKDAAAAVGLHPGYLQRLFKAHTGQTLMEYLTALRMEKAKMLLRRTDIPVAEIPDYVGVGSRSYFHALFKKHTGLTPVAYRRSLHTYRWREE